MVADMELNDRVERRTLERAAEMRAMEALKEKRRIESMEREKERVLMERERAKVEAQQEVDAQIERLRLRQLPRQRRKERIVFDDERDRWV